MALKLKLIFLNAVISAHDFIHRVQPPPMIQASKQ